MRSRELNIPRLVAVALLQEENLHEVSFARLLSCLPYIDSKYSTQFGNNLHLNILTMVHNGTLSPTYPMSDALRNAVVNCETGINEYLTDRNVPAEIFWKV
jgi:hypothetical protein